MRSRTLAGIIALFFLLGVFPAAGSGSDLDDLRQQQKELESKIKQQNRLLENKKSEGEELLQQLEELEAEIKAKEQEIQRLEAELEAAQARVDRAAEELARAEAMQQERIDLFCRRLKEIYQNGQVSYLEVLLQSTSFNDFVVRMELLGKIAENDMRLVEEIKAEMERIAAQKAALEAERDALAKLKRQADGERAVLASRQAEKQRLLARVEEEKKRVAQALDELEALSRQIAAKIRAIQAQNRRQLGPRGTSDLLWPLRGYTSISSPFGWRIHPLLKTQRFHSGIDIPAPMGTEVLAAEDGQVISTGFLGAYGNHIIIDHGGGFSTMYAHLSAILVREGQEVKRGQVIGRVGSTGWSTGPHLHFETQLRGEPTNPLQYY
ncbi:MAG: peptidoglycan DD-metalloendopeptidase family protein [Thermoanaerobacteraceae bacterium]|nr:peptidoglycan DD-metalloendopeptidase family protein [Thermoanaerobacteraceae bacterium]